ncbi:hypothetical protein [Streptomyces sp. B21-083]|uniref:hypothetical protein n=1 Tax=Streptomyces sp. B21-083 TaxID=3039410 RepID=UPI002FF3404A
MRDGVLQRGTDVIDLGLDGKHFTPVREYARPNARIALPHPGEPFEPTPRLSPGGWAQTGQPMPSGGGCHSYG